MDDNLASLLMTEDEDDDGQADEPCEKMSHMEGDIPRQGSRSRSGTRKRPRRRKRMLTGVSKQRRAANERERKRLQIINTAFKELKHILPLTAGEENISKIEIVRLAAMTIRHLADILKDEDNASTSGADAMNSPATSTESESTSSASLTELYPDQGERTEQSEQAMAEPILGEVDLSFLLFSADDMRLDSVDSGLEIPSPTISEVSSHDQLSFPFIDQELLDDDDVFCHGPTMIMW